MPQSDNLRRIIVPLDGSDFAERALPWAETMARLSGAPLSLIHVVDLGLLHHYGSFGLASERVAFEREVAKEHRQALRYLESVRQRLLPTHPSVDIEIRQGSVARELTRFLAPGDLIVIASHGRTGLKRGLLGSVADDVICHAPVPVLLIPMRAAAAPRDTTDPVIPGADDVNDGGQSHRVQTLLAV